VTNKLLKVAEHLDAARPDLLAFTAFPKQTWRQIWSNNATNDSTKKSGGAQPPIHTGTPPLTT
jgi:transposase-like protein